MDRRCVPFLWGHCAKVVSLCPQFAACHYRGRLLPASVDVVTHLPPFLPSPGPPAWIFINAESWLRAGSHSCLVTVCDPARALLDSLAGVVMRVVALMLIVNIGPVEALPGFGISVTVTPRVRWCALLLLVSRSLRVGIDYGEPSG